MAARPSIFEHHKTTTYFLYGHWLYYSLVWGKWLVQVMEDKQQWTIATSVYPRKSIRCKAYLPSCYTSLQKKNKTYVQTFINGAHLSKGKAYIVYCIMEYDDEHVHIHIQTRTPTFLFFSFYTSMENSIVTLVFKYEQSCVNFVYSFQYANRTHHLKVVIAHEHISLCSFQCSPTKLNLISQCCGGVVLLLQYIYGLLTKLFAQLPM